MIELQSVSLSFNEQKIFEDLNCKIAVSETFVLVGPSGSGKTCFLKLIAGLLRPTRGRVLIEGRDLHEISSVEREKIHLKMGMLFQKNALFDSLTGADNIRFPLKESGHPQGSPMESRIEELLESVGLLAAKTLFPDEMSGGMQKRLGIARAMALKPEIILYDDPTAGLDPITSRKIVQVILTLKEQTRSTMVAVTNDMNRAYQMGDRIAMIVDHGLVVMGSPTQTQQHRDPRVHQFITGRSEGGEP